MEQAFGGVGIPKPLLEKVEAATASLATVATGLGAIANILGFFKTDTTVGGIDAKLADGLLVHTVAGTLTRSTVPQRSSS